MRGRRRGCRRNELIRKLHLLRYGVLKVLLAFLAACGPTSTQPDPKPDPDQKPTTLLPAPNPVAVEVTRGSGYDAATIPTTGGTLEAVAEDGTIYRLTIAGAPSETRINSGRQLMARQLQRLRCDPGHRRRLSESYALRCGHRDLLPAATLSAP